MASISPPPTLQLPQGLRATRAMQTMLAVLPGQPEGGWTESLLEAALHQQGISVNRVTVYRALDRLVQAGLLQRSVDSQRLSRYFVAASPPELQSAAHLECSSCHQHIELGQDSAAVQSALQALQQALSQSAGLSNPSLNITVQGECPQCAAPSASASSVF